MRVPFTFNSKKLLRGCSKEDSIVTIRHRWNAYIPSVKQLLADFYIWLKSRELEQVKIDANKTAAASTYINTGSKNKSKYKNWYRYD
jgi:hypothetical protein